MGGAKWPGWGAAPQPLCARRSSVDSEIVRSTPIEAMDEVWEEVKEGEMPLWFLADRAVLRKWALERGTSDP